MAGDGGEFRVGILVREGKKSQQEFERVAAERWWLQSVPQTKLPPQRPRVEELHAKKADPFAEQAPLDPVRLPVACRDHPRLSTAQHDAGRGTAPIGDSARPDIFQQTVGAERDQKSVVFITRP